jgi:hypothetical protein
MKMIVLKVSTFLALKFYPSFVLQFVSSRRGRPIKKLALSKAKESNLCSLDQNREIFAVNRAKIKFFIQWPPKGPLNQ